MTCLDFSNKSLLSDQLVLFLSTGQHTNQPMIIDTRGKLYLFR